MDPPLSILSLIAITLLDDLLSSDEPTVGVEDDWVLLVASYSQQWPFRLQHPVLHSGSLMSGAANAFFDGCDSSSLEKVVRLSPDCFNLIFSHFQVILLISMKFFNFFHSFLYLSISSQFGRRALLGNSMDT